ncbi:PKD domain-containing protein [Chloroflexota bacterium]
MTKIFKPACLTVMLVLVLALVALVLPVSMVHADNGEIVDFSATPTSGNAPLTVQFENLSEVYVSDGLALASIGTTWLWDFGDGGTSTEECPTHTYNCAGEYDVSLTFAGYVNDSSAPNGNGGITETKYGYITVYPIADFSASPTMGIAPLTVQFRDQSKGLCSGSRDWSFGDGGSSTSKNPSHTYTQGGNYTITLTVSGSPSDTVTKLNLIIVEEGETPTNLVVRNLYISAVHAQPRQEVQITANVVNEGGTWGSDTVNLMINGQFEQSRSVGVAPGTAQTISFTVYKVQGAEYQVNIEGATGAFYVVEEPTQPAEQPMGSGPLDSGSIIAIIVIGVILVGGVVVIFLLSRGRS